MTLTIELLYTHEGDTATCGRVATFRQVYPIREESPREWAGIAMGLSDPHRQYDATVHVRAEGGVFATPPTDADLATAIRARLDREAAVAVANARAEAERATDAECRDTATRAAFRVWLNGGEEPSGVTRWDGRGRYQRDNRLAPWAEAAIRADAALYTAVQDRLHADAQEQRA